MGLVFGLFRFGTKTDFTDPKNKSAKNIVFHLLLTKVKCNTYKQTPGTLKVHNDTPINAQKRRF